MPVIDHLDIQQQSIARTAGAKDQQDRLGAGAAERITSTATAAPVSANTLAEPALPDFCTVADSGGPSTPASISSTSSSSPPPKSMPRVIRTPSKSMRVGFNKPQTHMMDEDQQDNNDMEHPQLDEDAGLDQDGQERHMDVDMEDDPAYHSDDARYADNDMYELKELERLASEPGKRELSTRNLVGQIAVCGQIAPGLNEEATHIWFAFSILSIRTEGFFKVRFCLSDLQRIPEGGKSTTICEVFSNTIHVQTPKRFEGTCDNNDIAIHLNKNSIKIPARKDEKKLNKAQKNSIM
ncbi:hypothetical protein EC991_001496 [Linnemannia zychae]|nr:hypothetical protein EC991_001496 [Linnemannia zychae]